MAKNLPQQDPEDARTDLLAAMAASRELGPEMDKAVVDSYMQKHHAVSPQPAAQPATQAPRASSGELISFMGMGLGLVAFITVLVVSHGMLWWMFWPLMCWAGWRWGWGNSGRAHNDEYHSARDEYRQARWEYRMQRRAARFGLPYEAHANNGYDQQTALPPHYPQTPRPQYPQPQAPAPVASQQPVPAAAPDPAPIQPPSGSGTPQPPLNPAG